MLIIIEGPDGAGKTTLAHRLMERIDATGLGDATYIHKGPPETGSLLEEYLLPLADYVPGNDRHVICDRWHLGELVYPGLLDRPSLADDRVQLWYLQLFLSSRGAVVVHVDANYDDLMSRLHRREVMRDYEFEIATQRSRFRRATELAAITLPHGVEPHETTVDTVLKRAQAAESGVRSIVEHPTYVGVRQPEYLLLGDRRGNPQRFPTAFAPNGHRSARYLLETIPITWLKLGYVGLANALETKNLGVLWRNLGWPRTVTLGRTARDVAIWHGVQAAHVPHPQYVKRFHYRRQRQYGEIIQRALSTGEDLITWRP